MLQHQGHEIMKNFIDVVTGRRSIRRYENRNVEDDTIQQLLETLRWTPSWANSQCWEIIVVRDSGIKEKISTLLSPKNPATIAVAKGPVLFAICSVKNRSGYYKGEASTILGDWQMYDLGLLTQTLCLSAHALGLGTVIVGAFDHLAVKDILKVPEGYELVSLVPIGYPDHAPSPPKRREVSEFVHSDTFGNKAV
jgi:nitroreductase